MQFFSQDMTQLNNVRYYLADRLRIEYFDAVSRSYSVDQIFSLWLIDKASVEDILLHSSFYLYDQGSTYYYFSDQQCQKKSFISLIQRLITLQTTIAIYIPELTFLENICLLEKNGYKVTVFQLDKKNNTSWCKFNELLEFLTAVGIRGVLPIQQYPAVVDQCSKELVFSDLSSKRLDDYKNFFIFDKVNKG
ncbi:hypothetical protein EBR43_10695 [bacterium]|nr:hypothetical protein [bacterium]NBW58224.1 hypothetical protein [bacterium]NBX72080.1 hypothetical protein [bacterium]